LRADHGATHGRLVAMLPTARRNPYAEGVMPVSQGSDRLRRTFGGRHPWCESRTKCSGYCDFYMRADVALSAFSDIQLSKIVSHPSAGRADHRVILPSSLPNRPIFRGAKLAGPLHRAESFPSLTVRIHSGSLSC
jgi:hypothetical protein